MTTDSSHNIVFEQIKKGDLKVFEDLFRKMYPDITNYAYKFVRQQEIAEEIAQDVFTYLWEKRGQIMIKSSLESYLFTATKNKSLNYIKLELPRVQSQIDISTVLSDLEDHKNESDKTESIKLFAQQAISELPVKCRQIFVLSRYEGLTYDEIAEDLDISKKTVENQMGIALKKLRKSLKPIINKIRE